jgi:porin
VRWFDRLRRGATRGQHRIGLPLGPVAPSGNEQGFELYYNTAITSWFTLSADIQAVDPAQFEARSAFLFGLRAKVDF